jgi:hypothetical protein
VPRGPWNLAIRFGTATLTHYGDVYPAYRFPSRMGFRAAIAREVRWAQRNNRYTVGEMLLALLYPMILGLERIETTQLLRQNGVFQYLTGLPSYPDATTLRRFLLRAAPTALAKIRRVHDRFLRRMSVRPRPPARLIFDLDSNVLVVYGRQEQAKIGYNPIKRAGRPTTPCCASMLIPPVGRSPWSGRAGTRSPLGFRVPVSGGLPPGRHAAGPPGTAPTS